MFLWISCHGFQTDSCSYNTVVIVSSLTVASNNMVSILRIVPVTHVPCFLVFGCSYNRNSMVSCMRVVFFNTIVMVFSTNVNHVIPKISVMTAITLHLKYAWQKSSILQEHLREENSVSHFWFEWVCLIIEWNHPECSHQQLAHTYYWMKRVSVWMTHHMVLEVQK